MENKSESIKELATALSKAQGEMPAVQFNAVNPFLKNKYADLGAIIATSKPILAKHGLSVSQMSGGDGDTVSVTTVLMHQSGEWMESTMSLKIGDEKGKSTAQVAGSIITYLRRYSLASILGMYADEDGDGNDPQPQKPAPKKAERPQAPAIKSELLPDWVNEVTNRDGEKYISIQTETLAHMANSIQKALAGELDDAARLETEQKAEAIKLILAARQNA
jgi:hypothetical protein